MRKIIFLILTLIVLASLPAEALAAQAGLSLTKDRRFILLTFRDLKNISKVSYTLTYLSNGRQKGFSGGFKTTGRMTGTTRKQILGTCSSGKCVYHSGVQNFRIDVTFTLKNGSKTTLTSTLP